MRAKKTFRTISFSQSGKEIQKLRICASNLQENPALPEYNLQICQIQIYKIEVSRRAFQINNVTYPLSFRHNVKFFAKL